MWSTIDKNNKRRISLVGDDLTLFYIKNGLRVDSVIDPT